MIPRKNGFTLIEMLFVLSICSIIITLSVPLIFSALDKQVENKFLETFEFDVLYMQNLSLGKVAEKTRIIFNEEDYTILYGHNEVLSVRSYPNHWTVDNRALETISFNSNGNIREAGVIFMKSKHAEYRLIFPLGKGRYYIDK